MKRQTYMYAYKLQIREPVTINMLIYLLY